MISSKKSLATQHRIQRACTETLERRQLLSTTLVHDEQFTGNSSPYEYETVGDRTFFLTQIEGKETFRRLWVTDGTTASTVAVQDFQVGNDGGNPRVLTAWGSQLAFFSRLIGEPAQLMVSDGTAAGTRPIYNFSYSGTDVRRMFAANGLLFVEVHAGRWGYELWRSDGTAAGTFRVDDAITDRASTSIDDVIAVGNRVYFTTPATGSGEELCVTDGSIAGTRKVIAATNGAGGPFESIVADGDTLYFARAEGGWGVWQTDGTEENTRRAFGVEALFSEPPRAIVTSNGLILAGQALTGGHGLFKLDAGGLVTLTSGTAAGYQTSELFDLGDRAAAIAFKGSTWRLLVSDGTAAGTSDWSTVPLSAKSKGFVSAGKLLFFAGQNVCSSDGTLAGTGVLGNSTIDLNARTQDPAELDGKLIFTGIDPKLGQEPHYFNSRNATTGILKDTFDKDFSGSPYLLGRIGDVAIYNGLTPPTTGTQGIWKLFATTGDGSAPLELATGYIRTLWNFGDKGIFQVNGELWVTDGTKAGTKVLSLASNVVSSEAVILNGVAYFAGSGSAGTELYRTDGTAAGTWRVCDVNPGLIGSSPDRFTVFKNKVYFVAQHATYGREVFYTDGTRDDIHLLRDFKPGAGDGLETYSGEIFSAGSELLVSAVYTGSAYVMWTSDGTPEGTVPVVDPAQQESLVSRSQSRFVLAGGSVYFNGSDELRREYNLVTKQITVAAPRTIYNVAFQGDLYYLDSSPAIDGNGFTSTLWRQNHGTSTSTAIRSWSTTQRPTDSRVFGVFNGRFYFVTDTLQHGSELWSSDGTTGGTRRETDLAPGPEDSWPLAWIPMGDFVLFDAIGEGADRELYRLDPDVLPVGTGVVRGTVFDDGNRNGTHDWVEGGLVQQAYVWLDTNANGIYDEGELQVSTRDDGKFEITGVPLGMTVLSARAGMNNFTSHWWDLTTPAQSANVGHEDSPHSLGLAREYESHVFVDSNSNGIFDSTEPGLPYVTVYLDRNNNAIPDYGDYITATNSKGVARFGIYDNNAIIRTVLPSTVVQTRPSADFILVTRGNGPLTIPIQFVLEYKKASIAGSVWTETDGDGVREAGEVAAVGKTVFIDRNLNGLLDVDEKRTTTDAEGNYRLDALPGGSYTILCDIESSWSTSYPSGGSHLIQLTGTNALGVDFGVKGPVPTVVLQSESATLSGGTGKSTAHPGYTGTGFADYAGQNSAVAYSLTRTSAGTATLEFRYANGSTGNRPLQILVNNVVVGTVACAPTGAWTTWKTVSLTNVALPSGTVSIKAVASTSNGGANVDSLTITSSGTVTPPPVDPPPVDPPPGSDTDLAQGKATTSSSNESAALSPDKATDGNAATRWASSFADNQWIRVDLGTPTVIGGVTLHWEAAFGKSYKIQGSTDGSNWTDLYSTTAGDGGVDNITVTNTSAWRYVRMLGITRGTKYGFSLFAFNVNAAGTVTPPPVDPPPVDPPPAGAKGSISGIVWTETDADGIREAGESLLSGKIVFIDLDRDGVQDAGEPTSTTNAAGVYTFKDLAAGNYRVGRARVSGYWFVNPLSGFHDITLAAGQVITTADIGTANKAPSVTPPPPPPTGTTGSISGVLFMDANKNGLFDGSDYYLKDKVVFIDLDGDNSPDSNEKQFVSDANGKFTFSGLSAGTYKIRRVVPAGYKQTSPLLDVVLTAGQNVSGLKIITVTT